MRRGIFVYRHCLMLIALLVVWVCHTPGGVSFAHADEFWQEGRITPLAAQPTPPAFVELAKALKPAVVNISTKQEVRVGDEDNPLEFFERFFGQRGRKRRRPGQGSGFIINVEGYIVTNNHVVESASEIKVTLATKEQFDAELIGRDAKTDLALLKITSNTPLPTVPVGNSDELEVGEWVMAIGNPFGLGHTVTTGIVSAKGRIIGAGPYDNFIQTDASINPGNSGGPLFNMRGEVIGINTAIVPQGQGIGFAIPSKLAQEILLQLRGAGKVTRGWLGVAIQGLTPDLVQAFGLENDNGALIAEILPDSPAEKAGLKRGDIILGLNDTAVESSSDLPRLVAAIPPNTKITLDILRKAKRQKVAIVLGTMKDDDKTTLARLQPSDVEEALGLRVRDITPEIARRLRLEDTEGVVIAEVDPNGPAAESGLRPGDIIREVNRTTVDNLEDYETATAKLNPDTAVLFLVERRGSNLYVAVKPQ